MAKSKKVQNVPQKSPFHLKVEEILGHEVQSKRVELKSYYHSSDDNVEHPLIRVEWTIGGRTGGSCWDDGSVDNHRPVTADPEPEFEKLDNILEAICPKITFLQYKKLCNNVVKRSEYTDHEYYGNYYKRAVKTVVLSDLEKYLKENNLWEE